MNDEELYQSITDICFENGGVTKPMADKLMLPIKQHREAYADEAKVIGYCIGYEDCLNHRQYDTSKVRKAADR